MKRWLLIIPSLFMIIALTGCYTVLKHPTSAGDAALEESYEDPNGCSRCHVDEAVFQYQNGEYYGYYQPLLDYYGRPWWWDAYWSDNWYYDDQAGGYTDGIKNPRDDRGQIGGFGTTPLAPSHSPPATKAAREQRDTVVPNVRERKTEESRVPDDDDTPEPSKSRLEKDDDDTPEPSKSRPEKDDDDTPEPSESRSERNDDKDTPPEIRSPKSDPEDEISK
ncbi:MAG: hypothetical protein B6244_04100 [Candidatus Cloacimonetes bacterium 4572_55]|nr:MAG: hypothetical protein B6244_04100 [Candidatus Cloacimonetes bacterium 4572_55]